MGDKGSTSTGSHDGRDLDTLDRVAFEIFTSILSSRDRLPDNASRLASYSYKLAEAFLEVGSTETEETDVYDGEAIAKEHLGERPDDVLRTWMSEMDVSVFDLEAETGQPKKYWSDILHRRRIIDGVTASMLADVFEATDAEYWNTIEHEYDG